MSARHPLADDAIATLVRLRAHAIAMAERAEQALHSGSPRRGFLPIMARRSRWETEAYHLRIALEAMGASVTDSSSEAFAAAVAEASMPEIRIVNRRSQGASHSGGDIGACSQAGEAGAANLPNQIERKAA